MCRLIATPPFYRRDKTIEILKDMEGFNQDGFGYAYVNEKGEFTIRKSKASFSWLLAHKESELLTHLDGHNGWTIIHQRKASCGEKKIENTHPFSFGDTALIHNGTWNDAKYARLGLGNHQLLLALPFLVVEVLVGRTLPPRNGMPLEKLPTRCFIRQLSTREHRQPVSAHSSRHWAQ